MSPTLVVPIVALALALTFWLWWIRFARMGLRTECWIVQGVISVALLAATLGGSAALAQNPHRSLCDPRTGTTGPEICVVLLPTSIAAGPPAPLPPIRGASPLAFSVAVGDYMVNGTATLTPAGPLPSGAAMMSIAVNGSATRTSDSGGPGTGVMVTAEGVPGGSLLGVSGSVELVGAATGLGHLWATGAALSESSTVPQDWRVHDLATVRQDLWGPFPEFFGLADHPPPVAATAGVPMEGVRVSAYFQVSQVGDTVFFPAGASIRLPIPASARGAAGPHFECYSVDVLRPQRGASVFLEDQFETGEVDLGPITRLCTPVSKNKESIPNPDVHLVCYAIVDGEEAGVAVSALSQIETVPMRVGKAKELCVPAIKRVVDEEKDPPPYEPRDPG